MLGLILYFGIFDLVCEDRDSKWGMKKDVDYTGNLNRIKKFNGRPQRSYKKWRMRFWSLHNKELEVMKCLIGRDSIVTWISYFQSFIRN